MINALRRTLRHLVTRANRATHNVLSTAITTVEQQPRDITLVILSYTDDRPEAIFRYRGVLHGEPLHQRLDALLEEHLDANLSPSIWVLTYHPCGAVSEEEITIGVA